MDDKMESRSFSIEHNIYRDTFSRNSEKGYSSQRNPRNDDASPTKRRYLQPSPSYKITKNESDFSHENGQVVENSRQLLKRLSRLFKNSELSDVLLVVCDGLGERREYPSHKLILCSVSEVFKVMFTGNSWSESNMSEVCLNEDPSLIPVFELFLEYLYSGQIALCHSTVLSVLILADKYDVKDLQEVCTNYMCSHLVSTVEQNKAVSWLQYGLFVGHKDLAQACQEFICWNFYKILSCPDFLNMDYDLLLFFLKRSDLVIPDEFILYQGVVQWWRTSSRPEGSRGPSSKFNAKLFSGSDPKSCNEWMDFNPVRELFSDIRFPLMTHTQLKAISSDASRLLQLSDSIRALDPDLSPRDGRLDVLLTVVEEFARKALMLQDVAKSSIHFADLCNYLKSKSNESQVTPRNYTNEIWSTTLCIDKFSSLLQHEVRSVVFSSPSSSLLPDEANSAWDWTAELFPKGVAFQRCIMIGLWRNVEVQGDFYDTVRLTLHCNQSKEWDCQRGLRKVTACILVTGVQDGVEHVCRVEERILSFDPSDGTRHINDLVPFHLLNNRSTATTTTTATTATATVTTTTKSDSHPSCTLLSGPEGDSLKITIVIKPSSNLYFRQESL